MVYNCFEKECIKHFVALKLQMSWDLGGGNPQAAKMTVKIIMVLVIAEMVIVGMILFSCCYVLGHAFSNEKVAVDLLQIWSLLYVSQ